jgi:hypothetical protein
VNEEEQKPKLARGGGDARILFICCVASCTFLSLSLLSSVGRPWNKVVLVAGWKRLERRDQAIERQDLRALGGER